MEEFYRLCEEFGITDDGERWCYKGMRYREIWALLVENGLEIYFSEVDIPDDIMYKYVG